MNWKTKQKSKRNRWERKRDRNRRKRDREIGGKKKKIGKIVVILHNEWYPIKTDESKRKKYESRLVEFSSRFTIGMGRWFRVLTGWKYDHIEIPRTTMTETN